MPSDSFIIATYEVNNKITTMIDQLQHPLTYKLDTPSSFSSISITRSINITGMSTDLRI